MSKWNIFIRHINLRGVREAGTVMAIPVYLFLFTYLPMLGFGLLRLLIEGPGSLAAAAPAAIQPVTLILMMNTFSAGCTALTGIEAISNGVPSFQSPEAKNAGRTLIVMAVLMAALFAGSIGLTQYLAVIPDAQETILSALARRLLGSGFLYFGIQVSTMLVLAVAATLGQFRTILGREAGVTLIAMLLALKTLEARARRDALVIFFLGFFTTRGDGRSVGLGIALAVGFSAVMSLAGLGWLPERVCEGIRAHFDGYYTGFMGHVIMFALGYAAARVLPKRHRDLTNLTVWTQEKGSAQETP